MTTNAEKKPDDPVLALPRSVKLKVPGNAPALALVFPLGIRQARVHKDKIASAFATVAGFIVGKDDSVSLLGLKSALREKALGPAFLDLVDVVADCVRFEPSTITLDQLTHDNLAPIMAEWVDVSFFEEDRYRPWWEMVTTLLAKMAETVQRAVAKSASTSAAGSSS